MTCYGTSDCRLPNPGRESATTTPIEPVFDKGVKLERDLSAQLVYLWFLNRDKKSNISICKAYAQAADHRWIAEINSGGF